MWQIDFIIYAEHRLQAVNVLGLWRHKEFLRASCSGDGSAENEKTGTSFNAIVIPLLMSLLIRLQPPLLKIRPRDRSLPGIYVLIYIYVGIYIYLSLCVVMYGL